MDLVNVPGEGVTRPCDECGELTPRLELVPRRDGPEPWLPTRWICANCDDDAAQATSPAPDEELEPDPDDEEEG